MVVYVFQVYRFLFEEFFFFERTTCGGPRIWIRPRVNYNTLTFKIKSVDPKSSNPSFSNFVTGTECSKVSVSIWKKLRIKKI